MCCARVHAGAAEPNGAAKGSLGFINSDGYVFWALLNLLGWTVALYKHYAVHG